MGSYLASMEDFVDVGLVKHDGLDVTFRNVNVTPSSNCEIFLSMIYDQLSGSERQWRSCQKRAGSE